MLFVSHNMQAISRLCQRVILLDGGHVNHDGKTVETVRRYLELYSKTSTSHIVFEDIPEKPIHLIEACLVDKNNTIVNESIDFYKRFFLKLNLRISAPIRDFYLIYSVFNIFDEALALFDIRDEQGSVSIKESGIYEFCVEIPNPLFVPGTYKIMIKAMDRNTGFKEMIHDCLSFEIKDPNDYRGIERPGFIFQIVKWSYKKIKSE